MKTLSLKEKILRNSLQAAERVRRRFPKTLILNLISSPGSGKTTLLEATLLKLSPTFKTAVLVGDVATQRDAERIAKTGTWGKQIITGGSCHLDARLVEKALPENFLPDLLFVENVGNLICPTAYDLGEDAKVVLISTTEGEDKPLKYPGIFQKAEVSVITKMDLITHLDISLEQLKENIYHINPHILCLALSAKTGEGMEGWFRWLIQKQQKKLANASS